MSSWNNSIIPHTFHVLDEFSVGIWIVFGHSQMFLRGKLWLVSSVLTWDDFAIDISVGVVGDVGMNGVSDVEAWSFVDWCVATGWDLCNGAHAGLVSVDGRSVIIVFWDGWWMAIATHPLLHCFEVTVHSGLVSHERQYFWMLLVVWYCAKISILLLCKWVGGQILFYELQFCKKMKNEAKMGFRKEQEGDEVRCKHAFKCNAIAIQSLLSKITLHFLLQFWNW